jgi:2-hydroxychromene-2-carboxylate isomerase
MIQTIEIFYSFQCPYSYLAIDRLSQLESKFDIKVLWQPFSAKASGKTFQNSNFPPDKLSYLKEDVVRIAQAMEMPLVMRSDWPEEEPDPERSIRGAVVACDQDLILEYNIKMFHRWWGEGEDPNDQGFFVELCDDLDIDPNEFSGRINTTDTRERVRGIYKRGRKLQVFDTPTIIIGEERFVGIDRIGAAEDKLREMQMSK